MPVSSLKRTNDTTGSDIKTITDSEGRHIQVSALSDADGAQSGIEGNPLVVTVDGGIETGGLTNVELRLTPVPVSVAELPLPLGAATAAHQVTQNTSLAAIQVGTALGAYGTNDVEEASATVTYVGKETAAGGTAWLVQKINTATGTNISYATILNNGSVLTYAAAWAARASLTYGTFAQAF